jgi:UDP-4-amino-4,6-dideoxy-N-acetyl-beta-L-altrosamine transaminase
MAAFSMHFLPYGRHSIDDDDVAAVAEVLRSDWLTGGPVVERFELAFAERMGARYAVACASGTAGLHMATLALKMGPREAMVVPALTFLATANAARFVGAEVIFADVDPASGLMGPQHLEPALARAKAQGLTVRAVAPVHYAGQAVDVPRLRRELDDAGLTETAIIEDACHAVGTSMRNGEQVGDCTASAAVVFSLHPVKTVAMGEGGVVTTNDGALDVGLRRARNHGMVRQASEFANPALGFDATGQPNPWYYEMQEIGYNYRASSIHCALGLSQLNKLHHFAERRRALVALYDQLLAPLAPVVLPLGRREACDPAWHLYVVRIDFAVLGKSRAAVMRELAGRGIGTQVHYMPLHLQPYYRQRYGDLSLPGAEALYARILSLPLFPAMADSDVARVVEAVTTTVGG